MNYDKVLHIRISQKEHKRLEDRARAKGMTVSAYTRFLIAKKLKN